MQGGRKEKLRSATCSALLPNKWDGEGEVGLWKGNLQAHAALGSTVFLCVAFGSSANQLECYRNTNK